MITLGIAVAVGYLLLFALCRKSAQADQVTESWQETMVMQVAVRPVPQTGAVAHSLPRTS